MQKTASKETPSFNEWIASIRAENNRLRGVDPNRISRSRYATDPPQSNPADTREVTDQSSTIFHGK